MFPSNIWLYILIFVFVGVILSFPFKSKFQKNFFLADGGGVVDFPMMLSFLMIWGSIYLGFQAETDSWKDYRQGIFETAGLEGDYHPAGILLIKSNTKSELIDNLFKEQRYYKAYEGYTLEKWKENGCVYPKLNGGCDDRAKKIYKEIEIIVSDLFPRKAEFLETQMHYFNLPEYRNPNAMYFQYFFIFVFLIILLIHIQGSNLIWGIIQTIFRVPIMGPLAGALIIFNLYSSLKKGEKVIETKKKGKAISEGIKKSKREKYDF